MRGEGCKKDNAEFNHNWGWTPIQGPAKGRAEKSTRLHFPVVTKQWELSSGAMADCGVGWDVGKFVVRCVKKDTN